MRLGRFKSALARARAPRSVRVIVMIVIINLFVLVIFLVVIVAGNGVLDALGQTITVKGLGDVLVLGDGS